MPKAYQADKVESKWYQFWLEKGYFTPKIDPEKKPFVIIMPPPNVTGELHVGHALTATLEDIMTRWHRMKGDPTLWLPGVDHAGIATQNVVEKELLREGLSRHDLGREGFLKRVWEWVGRYRHIISRQHQRLGASCDWARERFTMDEGLSKAVLTVFVRLYREGLIYKDKRLVNWDPVTQTALADDEVEMQDVDGHFWYMNYPVIDDNGKPTGEFVTVATTRPETMLGDTAVAVNPNDAPRAKYIGRRVRLPIVNRIVPIIADDYVVIPDPASDDPKAQYATGFLKVTPAHDPNDFEIGETHGLPRVTVIGTDARMSEEAA